MPTLPSDILITLLSNALLVVPLAIAVVLICRFVKRPAVAWCLWALVLLKFVTPAWYPLPVEDMTTLLTAAAPDEPSASIPLSDVMLTNLPLPVAELTGSPAQILAGAGAPPPEVVDAAVVPPHGWLVLSPR